MQSMVTYCLAQPASTVKGQSGTSYPGGTRSKTPCRLHRPIILTCVRHRSRHRSTSALCLATSGFGLLAAVTLST
eukprot:181788-Hanusia_phi.AAC.2